MIRNDTHRYLITYDIPDDKRRTRISKLLKSYGERMQFSVFLIDLHRTALVELTEGIKELIEHWAVSRILNSR
ncbi:CRISPR-associated endonuclease Cas2 [Flaviflexus massiliensis]|uniref:CRISPR-associated endonuclease Cas2 n=1 Tax=Flaviflexus massiliensis TaxID=1522309 RepID=UPI0006D5AB5F